MFLDMQCIIWNSPN